VIGEESGSKKVRVLISILELEDPILGVNF
jgi:hypothetical protein